MDESISFFIQMMFARKKEEVMDHERWRELQLEA
jgi:hypothetical protein